MDKYLLAIQSEEKILNTLTSKRKELVSTNTQKEKTILKCDEEYKKLSHQNELNLLRKEYLTHKKEYIKSFFNSALKFGLKSGLCFVMITLLLVHISNVYGTNIETSFWEFLMSDGVVTVLFGWVEYYSKSRDFSTLVSGYDGNIDDDIENTNDLIKKNQMTKCKAMQDKEANAELIKEIDQAISEVKAKLLQYRAARNDIIDKLIANLDEHISGFEYEETDISPVAQKKIHL